MVVNGDSCDAGRQRPTEFLSFGPWHGRKKIDDLGSLQKKKRKYTLSMLNVSQSDLSNLETSLLNVSGNVPLHNRFRALFTLKALKSDEAVRIISKGPAYSNQHRQIKRARVIDVSCRLPGPLCPPQA